jgi:hypothetical protein
MSELLEPRPCRSVTPRGMETGVDYDDPGFVLQQATGSEGASPEREQTQILGLYSRRQPASGA